MQTDDPNKKPNNIKHYIIRHSKENNTYFIRQQMPFNSIAELLEFFKNNKGSNFYHYLFVIIFLYIDEWEHFQQGSAYSCYKI